MIDRQSERVARVDLHVPGQPQCPGSLSVLVVNFNTRALVCTLLESIAQEARAIFEIIVVDNASTDDSVAEIQERFPDIRLIALTQNIGFARANNLAASVATGHRLLLLNSDTIVLPGAIDQLLAFAEERAFAGIWGGRTVFADGTLNPTSCWRRMTLWSVFCRAVGLSRLAPNFAWFNPEAYCGWKRDDARAVDIVTGCFLLIDHALRSRLGGFDPAFFMYGEEFDLCLKARAIGARPMITPAATIIHHVGASRSDTSTPTIQILAARLRNIRLHFSPWQRVPAMTLTRAGALFRWGALNIRRVLDARCRGRRDDWREVMRRRTEWWNGYPSLTEAGMLHENALAGGIA